MCIVFMGTPAFSVPVLAQLCADSFEVVSVYTQPDRPSGRGRRLIPSPVKEEALKLKLDLQQPEDFKKQETVKYLADLEPDIIVVASYGQILPENVLEIPRFGCLNIHPSLLPKYRGSSPVSASILNGDEETGVTIMLMDTGLDTGPILTQIKIAIEPQDTTGSLSARLSQLGASLIVKTIPRWTDNKLQAQPQDNDHASYTRTISKQDGKIDWGLPAIEIWRRVRAFQPWPGCYTFWHGKLLKIMDAIPVQTHLSKQQQGLVVTLDKKFGAATGVVTGEGILALEKVQLEGKRPVLISDFILGQRGFIGAILVNA